MTDDPIDFKLILDQYNGQIDYVRDISQKIMLMQLTYIGAFSAYAPLRAAQQDHRGAFLAVYVAIALFVALLQWGNYRRMQPIRHALAAASTDLSRIGILPSDPTLTIAAWAAPFFVMHAAFVAVSFTVGERSTTGVC
jgi:hypothetical protein